jgi:hypothetical protein
MPLAGFTKRGPDGLCGQPLAPEHQVLPLGSRLAQEGSGRTHAGLRGGLRPADAGELVGRLHPPPRGDGLSIRTQNESIGSEPVGDRDGHIRIDDGPPHAHRGGGAGRQLHVQLVPVHAAVEQLLETERREVVQHGIRRRGRNPVDFEWTGHDVHPPARDSEEKRIQNHDRELVAHRRRAFRVSVEQEVGHGRPG